MFRKVGSKLCTLASAASASRQQAIICLAAALVNRIHRAPSALHHPAAAPSPPNQYLAIVTVPAVLQFDN